MAENPNNKFLKWAVDWLIFKKKAKNQEDIANSIEYQKTSLSQALGYKRSFPSEKLTELIEKYDLMPYYRRFQINSIENPFDNPPELLSIAHEPTQKGYSLAQRVANLERELAKQADLIDALYDKLKITR